MHPLQQAIKEFHETVKPILQKIVAQYAPKTTPQIYHTIVKPSKRLIQKCSFKSILDTSRLNSIAYWLYIYDQKALALEICEIIHDVDVAWEETSWNYGIQNIYGLEIRIARELLGEDRKDQIPPKLFDYYFSKNVKKRMRYPQILREEEIAACDSRCLAMELFYALFTMIGHGETRFYTEVNQHWEEVEQAILSYVDCLKKMS